MTEPPWVWDVLADLIRYEDTHAKGQACMETILQRVPTDVRNAAAVIANYRVEATDTPTTNDEETKP